METNSRRQISIVLALIIAITFAVFGRALFFDFVNWDDDRNIIANPLYQAPLSSASLNTYWRGAYQDQYMPVTWTTWAVLAQASRTPAPLPRVGGEPTPFSPVLFHLLALGCHAINAGWVFLLLRRLLSQLAPNTKHVLIAALFGALIWALHPLQTEAAAWINGGNITYAYFWGLPALYFYLRGGAQSESGNLGAARLSQGTASALFLLALLSKPTTVCLLAVALALEWFVYRRPVRVFLPRLAVWSVLAVAVLAVTWSFSRGSQSMADIAPAVYLRPLIAGDALAFTLQKMLFPLWLAPDYGQTPRYVLQTGTAHLTTLGVVLLGVVAWVIARRFPTAPRPIPAALLVAGLLPTLGFVPFYFQRYSTFADRYAYIAMLAPALTVAWIIALQWEKHKRGLAIALGAILLVLTEISLIQTGTWRSNDTLFSHAVRVNPRSAVMWYNRANALTAEGRYLEAEGAYDDAVRLAPGYVEAWTNMGVLFDKSERTNDALYALRTALRYDAGRPEANTAIGLIIARQGKPAEAIPYWEHALLRAPNDADTRFNLAVAYGQTKQFAKARTELETVVKQRPDLEIAQRLLRSLPKP